MSVLEKLVPSRSAVNIKNTHDYEIFLRMKKSDNVFNNCIDIYDINMAFLWRRSLSLTIIFCVLSSLFY